MDRRTAMGWVGSLGGLVIIWSIINATVWRNEIAPIREERSAFSSALAGVNAGSQGPQEGGDCVICGNFSAESYDPASLAFKTEMGSIGEDVGCELDLSVLSYFYSTHPYERRGEPFAYTCVRFSSSQ